MISRVATFALSDQMTAGALRSESAMANLQTQEASSLKSEFLAGYGADTQQIVNLQVSVTRSQSYIDGLYACRQQGSGDVFGGRQDERSHHESARAAQRGFRR